MLILPRAKFWRERAGLTQQALALRADVSIKTVYTWEKRGAERIVAYKILDALNDALKARKVIEQPLELEGEEDEDVEEEPSLLATAS